MDYIFFGLSFPFLLRDGGAECGISITKARVISGRVEAEANSYSCTCCTTNYAKRKWNCRRAGLYRDGAWKIDLSLVYMTVVPSWKNRVATELTCVFRLSSTSSTKMWEYVIAQFVIYKISLFFLVRDCFISKLLYIFILYFIYYHYMNWYDINSCNDIILISSLYISFPQEIMYPKNANILSHRNIYCVFHRACNSHIIR